MSIQFENALRNHVPKPISHLEFRRIWAPTWYSICSNGQAYFPQESNALVGPQCVASMLVINSQLGREIMGVAEHNRLCAIVNDATAKFNSRATTQDQRASIVLNAIQLAMDNGNFINI